MSKVAIIGGGIAGTTTAVELAKAGNEIIIIEKSSELGGNVKNYGCKAVDTCTKCNLCLVDDIIFEALKAKNIEILYQTRVNDIKGMPGAYSLGIEKDGIFSFINDLDYIILATGFTKWSDLETGNPEVYRNKRIIWASKLEEYLKRRMDHQEGKDPLNFGFELNSAVFIQCNGSRNIQEKAKYCSKVCCAYDYRMARVIKYFYPEIDIKMFFMDIQEGGFIQDITFKKLNEAGIDYINARPIKVKKEDDDSLRIIYEDQKEGKTKDLKTQLLVLSEGIHPNEDNEVWSRLFNLQLDDYGFLYSLENEYDTGIYLAGTIKGPKDIAGTIIDSKNIAYKILNHLQSVESKC
jgi:heterodisulfide reductase subunit A2